MSSNHILNGLSVQTEEKRHRCPPPTCCVPLQPQGLRPIVVRRCALGQDLDRLAEPLESSGQVPGLRRTDALQLQLSHLLQQAGVEASVCRREIKQVKKRATESQLTGRASRGKKKHTQENVSLEIKLD